MPKSSTCRRGHGPSRRWHHDELFVIYFLCLAVVGIAATAPFWADRVIVNVLRRLHIFAFPDAIRLAISLQCDTGEWRIRDWTAEHPRIGEIRDQAGSHSLHVLVKHGNDTIDWRPSFIERRIIWDALCSARAHVIHTQLDKVLPT